jgi:ribonucleoside-diphosphate reductase alpha chain
MTETSHDARTGKPTAGRPRTGKATGVKVERIFTTPGVHPYDEVTWERRDVVQANWRTGETIFEQKGVEFPDFWSINASTIVTTKYFRGAVGTQAREWSLKQLIDRVVLTYVKAGKNFGYFATDDDATLFEHELTWTLLHQVFAFNSPVWFNVGTSSPQQVSACFILAVDDTMDSILNWYREEGLIFKGGSGSGLNLSRIRSSKELLSSGGTASGPCRFMRGRRRLRRAPSSRRRDATRGARWSSSTSTTPTSRSSSRPRRARRTRSARCATPGFDMDLGGATSPPCSTRTPTTRCGSPTSSCARSSRARVRAARPADRRGARDGRRQELFRKIAQARGRAPTRHPVRRHDQRLAHQPETGRITASNPCSEYMHLDNSSCNLASLNLLKFLKDDGSFDAVRFAKAVEVVITAMDISICFADFPTEAIGRPPAPTAARHRLRQPRRAADGVGSGLRLRGWPGTGGGHHVADDGHRLQALRRAGRRRRPYDGYARNAQGHTRVMRKHQAPTTPCGPVHPMDISVQRLATQMWAAVPADR